MLFRSTMPAPVQLIVVAIAGIAAAIGPVMMIVGMLLPAFGAISTLLAGPMVAAAIAFALPFLPIIIAVAAIGIGLYLLYTYFKPFHDAVNQVVGWVKTLVGDLMSGNFSKLGTDFKNGIMAGIAALMKIDWGSVATQFLSALLMIPPQFLKALQSLDWGGLAHSVITFLTSDVPKFLDAMKNLDWGGFAMLVLQALCGLDIMFINALINLDWGGFANTVITALVNLAGNVLSAFVNLDWGSLGNAIVTAIENAIKGAAGDIAGAITGAVSGVKIPGTNVTLAEGGIVNKPTLALIGEAGPEAVIPLSGISNVGKSSFQSTSSASAASAQSGETHNWNIMFNNATLTSTKDAENLSLKMGYKAAEVMRRAGHAKG